VEVKLRLTKEVWDEIKRLRRVKGDQSRIVNEALRVYLGLLRDELAVRLDGNSFTLSCVEGAGVYRPIFGEFTGNFLRPLLEGAERLSDINGDRLDAETALEALELGGVVIAEIEGKRAVVSKWKVSVI